jgi:TfoX/Sxy family transcriptional regulator of competence genes
MAQRWKKSPPELVSAFDALMVRCKKAERRSMFGYPAAFVNGNMFAGLHEDRLVLRLDDDSAEEAREHGARDFEPMPGRAMKGWVAVPRAMVEDELIRGWLDQAFRHASRMPAKKARARRA